MDELPRFIIRGTAGGLLLGFPIVFWLVPSPEFREFALVGHVLGGLIGGLVFGYLGEDFLSKLPTRVWPLLLCGVLAVVCWAIYEFGWRQERIDNWALVGIAVLFFGAVISSCTALVVLMLHNKWRPKG